MEKPASQGNSVSNDPMKSASTENSQGQSPESKAKDIPSLFAHVLSLIDQELLRQKLQKLLEEKPTASRLRRTFSILQRMSSHSLVIVFASGVIGGLLTQYYTNKQKDIDYNRSIQQLKLTSQRSFLDELNKMRIQKIGEMWEQIDNNEVIIDSVLEKANKSSNPNDQKGQNVSAINSLIQEDRVIINKNRFWLGEAYYNKIKEYFDRNVQLALNVLLARPGTDLSEIIRKREQAKQDILQMRTSMLLEGEPSK
jgi:hypothetical protein